jgi:hypothetical protein
MQFAHAAVATCANFAPSTGVKTQLVHAMGMQSSARPESSRRYNAGGNSTKSFEYSASLWIRITRRDGRIVGRRARRRLVHLDDAIALNIKQSLHDAARPANLDCVGLRVTGQPEVHAFVVGRQVAARRTDSGPLRAIRRSNFDFSANSVAITFVTSESQSDPMIFGLRFIVQDRYRAKSTPTPRSGLKRRPNFAPKQSCNRATPRPLTAWAAHCFSKETRAKRSSS